MDWEEHNKRVQKERQRRRDTADEDFIAVHNRLFMESEKLQVKISLRIYSSSHYQLIYKNWIYNLYPGNQRIYPDPKHKGPFLNVPKCWTLSDIADAVIAHSQAKTGE